MDIGGLDRYDRPMRAVAVLPARLSSRRLPGKVLADLGGAPLIARVIERVRRAASIDEVIVATDAEEIANAVAPLEIRVIRTGPAESGTDRVARAVAAERVVADVIVNVQADEPFVDPGLIDRIVEIVGAFPGALVTACAPLRQIERLRCPSVVKVVPDARGRALIFTRAPVPWPRDVALADSGPLPHDVKAWEHVGLYGFTPDLLAAFAALPPHPLEQQECLEQLRALAWGWAVELVEADEAPGSVDTPEDLERARARYRSLHG